MFARTFLKCNQLSGRQMTQLSHMQHEQLRKLKQTTTPDEAFFTIHKEKRSLKSSYQAWKATAFSKKLLFYDYMEVASSKSNMAICLFRSTIKFEFPVVT